MPGVTRCTHAETGGEAELPTDALAAYVARGWEPVGESRTIEAADAERVTRENAAAEYAAPPKNPEVAPVAPANQETTAGDAGTKKES